MEQKLLTIQYKPKIVLPLWITWRADTRENADAEITYIADLQRIHYSD